MVQQAAQRETLFALGGFVAGALLSGGLVALGLTSQPSAAAHGLRESDLTGASQYDFIDPLIGIASSQPDSPQYAGLQSAVSSYIVGQKRQGLTTASVVFRDIRAGQGFVINPDELYSPASLYKVPLMMAYYDVADGDPSILNTSLTYTGRSDEDATENIKSNVQLTPGRAYTVEQLIEHMIKYSDNNALTLLKNYLDSTNPSEVAKTLGYLGVPYGTDTDFLKVGTYSIFFRTLYNATYLTPNYSEKALALLTQTDFAQGIEAGVPNVVQVAQKFGDSNLVAPDGTLQGYELHDCGIVYYPGRPYLLCVMTKGQAVEGLEASIAGISKLVYQDVERRWGAN
jgi:beta-lactamase class A